MQRGAYLIAISPSAVEGGRVSRSESQGALTLSILSPSNGDAPDAGARALLESFLSQAQWPRGPVVLVLPTEAVSVRRLKFAFNEPKKIRQILPYELEDEVLGELDNYAYDFQIIPRENGSAEVLVFLVDKHHLQELAEALDGQQLSLQRVTFSAQALVAADADPGARRFHVYVGSDEGFVAYAVDGRLEAVSCFSALPRRVMGELESLSANSSQELLNALFHRQQEQPDADPVLRRMKEDLQGVREEVNRFMRINGAGEDATISLHGLFGRFFRWRPDVGDLSLTFDRDVDWSAPRGPFFGVLTELLANPRNILAGRGINFYRRVASWVAQMAELKWPLIAMGLLVVVLAALLGGRFYVRTAGLEDRLSAAERDLQRTLNIPPPVNSLVVNSALAMLQERLETERKERQAVSYLDHYHYNTLMLLREISAVFQQFPELTVDALSFNRERFSLSGTTARYNESEALKNRIAGLTRFKSFTAKITHSRSAGQRIRYRISAER
ncbi:MAG: hypothetical protein IIA40_01710 [SAR324 cluster bacterium]|nr:hypothetical protein [SAR324 cluster bacterium]